MLLYTLRFLLLYGLVPEHCTYKRFRESDGTNPLAVPSFFCTLPLFFRFCAYFQAMPHGFIGKVHEGSIPIILS